MLTVDVAEHQIKEAQELYKFHNINNSITSGRSEIYGALGEVVVRDYFSKTMDVVHSMDYDYDLTISGYKVDVKTKKTTVVPKPNYNCSITAFNPHQKCDYYFFVRVTTDLKRAYLLGYIGKEAFFRNATFNKQGEDDGNFLYRCDCYNLPVSGLRKFGQPS